jgi:hypothetical protein
MIISPSLVVIALRRRSAQKLAPVPTTCRHQLRARRYLQRSLTRNQQCTDSVVAIPTTMRRVAVGTTLT